MVEVCVVGRRPADAEHAVVGEGRVVGALDVYGEYGILDDEVVLGVRGDAAVERGDGIVLMKVQVCLAVDLVGKGREAEGPRVAVVPAVHGGDCNGQ